MRFDWLVDIKINEVEGFAWVSMIAGIAMFVLGLLWDRIAGVQVAHHEGLGLMQIVWLSFWGLFTLYGWLVQNNWKE